MSDTSDTPSNPKSGSQDAEMQKLVAAAKAGDGNAMYRVASILGAEGHQDLSVSWLKKAAASGHADARFTLATYYLKGVHLDRNIPQALAILQTGVKDWHAPSVHLYATLLAQGIQENQGIQETQTIGRERKWQQAIGLLVVLVEKGESPAMVEIAYLLIMADLNVDLAHQLMQAAACRQNLHAGMYLAGSLTDNSDLIDAKLAGYWVPLAMKMGHPKAAEFKAIAHEETVPQPAWIDIPVIPEAMTEQIIEKLSLWRPKQLDILLDRPKVTKISGVIAPSVCSYIQALAAPLMQQAVEFDPDRNDWVQHGQMTGYVAAYSGEDYNLVSLAVADRMAKAASCSIDFAENLVVYALPEGGVYHPHSHFVDPDMAGGADDITAHGQVTHTLQLLVSPVASGGASQFGHSHIPIEWETGDMLVLDHCLYDGSLDDQAVLADEAVISGEKWIAQRLVRDRDVQS